MIVGVIGSGSIGPDLAYGFVSALARRPGARVYLHDIQSEALERGVERIRGYVQKGLARGKLSPKAAAGIEAALIPTPKLHDLAECEYVLEAATEDLPVKQVILENLEGVVKPDCLIGFATSGIPRAEIAARARHPQRCFVNHPFFPAWRSLPIEVVLSGAEAYGNAMLETLKLLGKVPVVTADVPCFAADDIFCNYISEAVRIVADGVATPVQVDRIVNDAIGGGGPFLVMDGTRGNLLTAHCQELMRDAPTGGVWFEPPALLTQQGDQPWHDRQAPGDSRHGQEQADKVMDRILAVLMGRTHFVVDEGICEPAELNWLTRMALGFRQGLLDLSAQLGPARVHELCRTYAEAHPGFPVPGSIAEQTPISFRRNVKLERDGEIAVLRVQRPEVKNALSEETIAEIEATIEELEQDDSVRGVVFTSYDGSLAGADILGLAALETPEDCRQICLKTHPIQARIAAMKKPIVAAVDGPVMGGGAEFSMACHARVVGPGLVLAQPEVNLGLIPGYGGTQRLPRLIGLGHALDLLRTGRSIGAKEACEWGWATGKPAAEPVDAAKGVIQDVLAGRVKLELLDEGPMDVPDPLPAIDLGHHSRRIDEILVDVLRRGLARSLAEGLTIEADGFARCKGTVDMDIGLKNFIQNGPRTPAEFLHE